MSIDTASPQTNSTVPAKRPSKAHVPSACINCKKAHLACDLNRPCNRCITMNKTDTCVDVQQKKRGRPKLRDKEAQLMTTSTPTTLMKSIHISLGSKSNFSMTRTEQGNLEVYERTTVITMFLSMEICCARVSDEVLELLGYYPQEMAHRPLYSFIASSDGERLARIHRLLLDNIGDVANKNNPSSQRPSLPATERTSSDNFFQYSPDQMSVIANGSQTLSELMNFKKDSGDIETYNCQFYLGGGWGADLFKPATLGKLYIVATFTPANQSKNTILRSPSMDQSVVKSVTPTSPSSAPATSSMPTGQIMLAPAVAQHSANVSTIRLQKPESAATIETTVASETASPRTAVSETGSTNLSQASPTANEVKELSFGLDDNSELVLHDELADDQSIANSISQTEVINSTSDASKTSSPKFHSSTSSTAPKFSPWPVTFPLVHSATRTSVNPYTIVSARYNRPLPMNVHVAPFTHPHDAYYLQMSSSLLNSEAAHQNRFNRRIGTIAEQKAHESMSSNELETRDIPATSGNIAPVNGQKNSQQMSVDALLS
ncbi:hypothetical protein NQZ79_g4690 [Umbelopsis isabellina]|nr:hypothetical protein NQZ79_g4690 [Umbelopsis isabellina]